MVHTLAAFDFGARLLSSIGHAFDLLLGFIPQLIGAILLIVIGWILSNIIGKLVERLLNAAHFDNLMRHAGIDGLAQRLGLPANANVLLAGLVVWFIRLIFLVAAFNALQVPAITNVLNAILLWLPSLFVALIIVVIGASLARVAAGAVERGMNANGISGGGIIAALLRYGIIALALIIALEQIGVGVTIITTLFGAVMLALALAFGLAFGLGGRDTAKRIVDSWYTHVSTQAQNNPRLGFAPSAPSLAAPQEAFSPTPTQKNPPAVPSQPVQPPRGPVNP